MDESSKTQKSARVAFHERAYNDVRKKIKNVRNLSDTQLSLSAHSQPIERQVNELCSFMEQLNWSDKNSTCKALNEVLGNTLKSPLTPADIYDEPLSVLLIESIKPSERRDKGNSFASFLKNLQAKIPDGHPLKTYEDKNLEEHITASISKSIAAKYWKHTRDMAMKESGIASELAPEIDDIAKRTVLRYTEDMHIRTQYFPKKTLGADKEDAPDDFYDTLHSREHLTNLLVNHVTNISDAELRGIGLNLKSAHAIQGVLIRIAIRIYDAIDYGNCYVNPQLGGMNESSESEIFDRTEKLKTYWRGVVNDISGDKRDFDSAVGRWRK